MIKKIAAILAFTTLTFNAHAGLINEYGVIANINGTSVGGKGSTSAEISTGSTQLLGQFQANSYLPTLKAITTDGYGRLVSIQAFQYTGSSPFDLDLSINLHGSSSGGGTFYENHIRADIGIIDAGNSLDGIDESYFNYSFSTIYFEPSEGFGVDKTTLNIHDEQDVNKIDTLSISLDMNQYFYVVTQLEVNATNGGVSDAWNTLNMSFSDTSNLLSAVPSAITPSIDVPEPSTFVLLALALFGFTVRKKI